MLAKTQVKTGAVVFCESCKVVKTRQWMKSFSTFPSSLASLVAKSMIWYLGFICSGHRSGLCELKIDVRVQPRCTILSQDSMSQVFWASLHPYHSSPACFKRELAATSFIWILNDNKQNPLRGDLAISSHLQEMNTPLLQLFETPWNPRPSLIECLSCLENRPSLLPAVPSNELRPWQDGAKHNACGKRVCECEYQRYHPKTDHLPGALGRFSYGKLVPCKIVVFS